MNKLLLYASMLLMSTSSYAITSSIELEILDNEDTISMIKTNDTSIFIPDGPFCMTQCTSSKIRIEGFFEKDIIKDSASIASVCINIEHSFVGDLGIYLVCPNGKRAALMTYLGMQCDNYIAYPTLPILPPLTQCTNISASAYLGKPSIERQVPGKPSPNDCTPEYNNKGVGWQYCWSDKYLKENQKSIGWAARIRPRATLDSSNFEAKTKFFIPDTSFANLIGCPLNGDWEILICDYYREDKGWFFSWSLELESPYSIPEMAFDSVSETKATISIENRYNANFILEYKKETDSIWISENISNDQIKPTTKKGASRQIELANLAPGTKYLVKIYMVLNDTVKKEIANQSFTTLCLVPPFSIDSITENSALITFENVSNNVFVFEYKKETDSIWISQYSSITYIKLTRLEENTNYQTQAHCLLHNGEKRYGNEIKVLTTKAIGIELLPQQEETLFEVFPNPVKDILTIATKGISGNVTIEILDVRGTRLQTQKIICQSNTQEYPISLTHLPKGIYFIQLTHNGYAEVKKVVLQ